MDTNLATWLGDEEESLPLREKRKRRFSAKCGQKKSEERNSNAQLAGVASCSFAFDSNSETMGQPGKVQTTLLTPVDVVKAEWLSKSSNRNADMLAAKPPKPKIIEIAKDLPEYIIDPGTKTTYLKGKFLGKFHHPVEASLFQKVSVDASLRSYNRNSFYVGHSVLDLTLNLPITCRALGRIFNVCLSRPLNATERRGNSRNKLVFLGRCALCPFQHLNVKSNLLAGERKRCCWNYIYYISL
ncbi:uncharacterized protein CDAR_112971 [Caerostris darwini]|uniref:Uncharacterized protein n=1 Tax=Caerostris darwini TaxID=1538125 RepID=A0AAV4Q1C9_9ARAC|nr:uncharacterized protein CDAR_112971 [Caerostris darwini]